MAGEGGGGRGWRGIEVERRGRKVAEIEGSSASSRSRALHVSLPLSFPLMMESERPSRPGKYRSGGI